MDKDKLFAQRRNAVDFKFDESVSRVFPDMIRRSVPGYETIIELTGAIAEKYAQPNTNVYDLGCALGASILSIYARIPHNSVNYIAIDNSEFMLEKCDENLSSIIPENKLTLEQGNIEDTIINNASVVVMNFTLQFVDEKYRKDLVNKVFDGLNHNGVFILSEKISFTKKEENQLQQQLHEQFKASNGYSELEISQKRSALERVMTLDDQMTHLSRLEQVGFQSVAQWFQSFNFVSFLGVK